VRRAYCTDTSTHSHQCRLIPTGPDKTFLPCRLWSTRDPAALVMADHFRYDFPDLSAGLVNPGAYMHHTAARYPSSFSLPPCYAPSFVLSLSLDSPASRLLGRTCSSIRCLPSVSFDEVNPNKLDPISGTYLFIRVIQCEGDARTSHAYESDKPTREHRDTLFSPIHSLPRAGYEQGGWSS